jgi:hypothetical protein
MLIIAILYIGIAWLVFFRFKLLPWNWRWRIVSALLGCVILAVFIALLNTLTPSGRIAVVGRVVEVTPNVAGTVTSIPVETNVSFFLELHQCRSKPQAQYETPANLSGRGGSQSVRLSTEG